MAKTYVNNNYEFILIRIVYIQIYIFCYKKFKNGIKEWKTNLVKLFRSNLAKYLIQIVFVNKVLENKIDGQNVYTLKTQQKYIRNTIDYLKLYTVCLVYYSLLLVLFFWYSNQFAVISLKTYCLFHDYFIVIQVV